MLPSSLGLSLLNNICYPTNLVLTLVASSMRISTSVERGGGIMGSAFTSFYQVVGPAS